MSASRSTLLFVPPGTTALHEMRTFVDLASGSLPWEPVFFLSEKLRPADSAACREAGIRTLGPGARPGEGDQPSSEREHELRESAPTEPISKTWLGELRRFAGRWLRFEAQRRTARMLLRKERVIAVVVGGDGHLGWETVFVREGKRCGVPSLVLPYAWSDRDSDARFRTEPERASLYRPAGALGRLVRAVFPRWVYEYQGTPVLHQPLSIALAAWFHRMMPPRPWSIAGGRATCAAVESNVAKLVRIAEGVPAKKLEVTGKASDDLAAQVLLSDRAAPEQVRALTSGGGSLLLLAVPQLAEHGFLTWEEHWKEMEFLFSTLRRNWDGPILASTHPKSDPEAYKPVATAAGIEIADERLLRLLPFCDVFVATYSSTVVQAIALAKPSIVVDFYGMDYTFYDDAPGVVVIRERTLLEPELRRMQSDAHYRDRLCDAQRQAGADWCRLDGRSTDRLVALLRRLAEDRGE